MFLYCIRLLERVPIRLADHQIAKRMLLEPEFLAAVESIQCTVTVIPDYTRTVSAAWGSDLLERGE